MTLDFVALGLDHGNIVEMTGHMIAAGGRCLGFWTQGTPDTLPGFVNRYPELPQFDTLDQATGSGAVLALIACVPSNRAELAIRAMHAGLDVLVDTPGCTTLAELQDLRDCVSRTGRIWSVDYRARLESRAATLAGDLIAAGEIGRVLQTAALASHRLTRDMPTWFLERVRHGGILADLGAQQIDQFLHATGSAAAEITLARVANHANPDTPGLQDFGEIGLRSARASGYVRVDWLGPASLPRTNHSRLTILGTEGYIEIYVPDDVTRNRNDHLMLVNGTRCERLDASASGLPFFQRLVSDIRDRTETAMNQAHCFAVMELALTAQAMAEGD